MITSSFFFIFLFLFSDSYANQCNIDYLKKDCFCRKPNPGMMLELSYQRNIDLNSSLFVGDSLADSQAANSAGCEFKNIITL